MTTTYALVFALAYAPAPRAPAAAPAPPSTAPADPAPEPAPEPAAGQPPATGESTPTPSDKVTRYSFTGLDIDGELRTPALLQFLARIAGEFETVGIPHRSFLPELSRTVREDVF
jgi:hypothetical protein